MNIKRIGEHGIVSLVEVMGSDTTIEESARVSFGTENGKIRQSNQRDLLRYLVRHNHSSPLEMGEVRFYLKMPIFVMRQLVRHRTASINEVSGRYKELPDEMFVPELDDIKAQSKDNKQGRGDDLSDDDKATTMQIIKRWNKAYYSVYQSLLGISEAAIEEKFPGIAKELARVVLPLSTYTELYWKCDLKNFLHMIRLRTDPHAQKEIRDFADAMYKMVKPHFPIVCEAWEDYVRDSVTFSKQEAQLLAKILSLGVLESYDMEMDENKEGFSRDFKLSKREYQEFISKWDKMNKMLQELGDIQ